jgi:hypothetical protein
MNRTLGETHFGFLGKNAIRLSALRQLLKCARLQSRDGCDADSTVPVSGITRAGFASVLQLSPVLHKMLSLCSAQDLSTSLKYEQEPSLG